MSPYLFVLSVHAVVAVVGVGLFGAIPLVASASRRAGASRQAPPDVILPLFRYTRISLVR